MNCKRSIKDCTNKHLIEFVINELKYWTHVYLFYHEVMRNFLIIMLPNTFSIVLIKSDTPEILWYDIVHDWLKLANWSVSNYKLWKSYEYLGSNSFSSSLRNKCQLSGHYSRCIALKELTSDTFIENNGLLP